VDSFAHNQGAPVQNLTRRRLWIPATLLALFAIQSLWFINTQSLTYDEPAHIIPGIEAWQQGKFEHWNDQPPLARLWVTLPMARVSAHFAWQQLPTGFVVTEMQPGPEWIAWRTRPMTTILGVVLGLALWFAARRLFSEGAANVALSLFVSTPSLIAHFSLATTDGLGALFVFLAAFQLVRWRRRPSSANTALMGLVLGALLLAKFYAPPLVLLALGLMVVLTPWGLSLAPRNWNWKAMLGALAVAILTLWAGYFFHVSHVQVGDGQVVATYPNRAVKTWATKSSLRLNAFVPAGEFIEGVREIAMNNRHGRPSWFLGKIYPKGGIRLYYPVAIALKWPTIALLLFFASVILGLRKTCRAWNDLVVMSLLPLLYLVFALQSRYDIGERHILPLYPFVLLIAGGIWEHARKHRVAVAILVFALCLNAADALRYAPDYLSYFNIFVRPENSWRLLTDSNLDWGQGLIGLRSYAQQHPNERLRLAYFGSVDPALYGVRAMPLPPGEVVSGTVVVGASCLSGQVLPDPDAYHWLWDKQPERLINHSLWGYEVGGK
jgi:hypothetical protein